MPELNGKIKAIKDLLRIHASDTVSLPKFRLANRAAKVLGLTAEEVVELHRELEFYNSDGEPYWWLEKALSKRGKKHA